jgi:dimethylargininase
MRHASSRLSECALEYQARVPIDVERAAAQQRHLAAILERLGVRVSWLAAAPECPDCCYIEDTVVIIGKAAVITNPGTAARRAEIPPVREWLADRGFAIVESSDDAKLEGGDVLRIEDFLLVGESGRTTDTAGCAGLRDVAQQHGLQVVAVPVVRALHLKTACTYLGNGVLIAVEDAVPSLKQWKAVRRTIGLTRDEMPAANTVALGATVLVPEGWPDVCRRIELEGFDVIEVDISEHQKAEAGLTCLALFL